MPRVKLKTRYTDEAGRHEPGSVVEIGAAYLATYPWVGDVVVEEVAAVVAPVAPEPTPEPEPAVTAPPPPSPAASRGRGRGRGKR